MTRKDQVFVVDVVVTNSTRETMASSVISWPINVVAKFNAIVKIRKYKGLHEGHHFMMHLNVIWIVSLVNVFVFSMIDNWEVIYLYLFAFSYSHNVLLLFFNVL
jgi:hypothetical protein